MRWLLSFIGLDLSALRGGDLSNLLYENLWFSECPVPAAAALLTGELKVRRKPLSHQCQHGAGEEMAGLKKSFCSLSNKS